MARKKSDEREFTVAEEGAGPGRVRAFALTLLAVAVILLGAGYFAAQTESFRQMVEDRIERRTGLDVSVERTRIGWPYSLVVERIASEARKGEDLAGITIKELRIGLGSPLVRIHVRGCTLSMLRLEDGTWRPGFLARVGTVEDVEHVAGLTESFRRRMRLEIEQGTILWFGSDGSRLARVEGLDFSIAPVKLDDRRLLYLCRMSVHDVINEDGGRAHDLESEWLFTHDNRVIEIDHREDGGESRVPGHALWSRNPGTGAQ